MITVTIDAISLTLGILYSIILPMTLFEFYRYCTTRVERPRVSKPPSKSEVPVQHRTLLRGPGSVSRIRTNLLDNDDSDLGDLGDVGSEGSVDAEDARPPVNGVVPPNVGHHATHIQVVINNEAPAQVILPGGPSETNVLYPTERLGTPANNWQKPLRMGVERMKKRCEELRQRGGNPSAILVRIGFVEKAMARNWKPDADMHMKQAHALYDLASKRVQRAPFGVPASQAQAGPSRAPGPRLRGASQAENRSSSQSIRPVAGSSTGGRQTRSSDLGPPPPYTR